MTGGERDVVRDTIDAVWRIEQSRLIAALARRTGDVAIAEDLAQDALIAALEQWPVSGVPDNPGAWLFTAARRRSIDSQRHHQMADRKHEEIARALDAEGDRAVESLDEALDDFVGDDLLRLIFVACHPVLSPDARVALTLRLLGGLSTGEIARAFLVQESTISQRIVRAKRTLTEARVPFEVPRREELVRTPRLGPRGDLLRLQRRLFRDGRRRPRATGVVRGCLAPRSHRRRADAE